MTRIRPAARAMAPGNGPLSLVAGRGRMSGLAVVLLCLLAAAWAVLSKQLIFLQTDSLLWMFASLYDWTPYIWGESRFGMLLPLLAIPIRNPILNLIAQQTVGLAVLFSLPFLFARWLLGPVNWLLAGLLGLTVLLSGITIGTLSFIGTVTPYPVAAALALAAFLALDSERRHRLWIAAAFWSIACWVTPSVLFWAGPMIVLREALGLRADLRGPNRLTGRFATVLAAGVALAIGVAFTGKLVPIDDPTTLALSSRYEWPLTWALMAKSVLAALASWLTAGVALTLAGIAVASWVPLPQIPRSRMARIATAVVLTIGLEFLFVGIFAWVAKNERETALGWRYVSTGMILTVCLVPMLLATVVGSRRSARARVATHAIALLLACAALVRAYGLPDVGRSRKQLAYCLHQNLFLDGPAHAIIDSGASFVVGNYWTVYPLVFRINSILHERGEKRIVWPIADRAERLRSRWGPRDWTQTVLAALPNDPWIDNARGRLGVPELEEVGVGNGVVFWKARAPEEFTTPKE